jgi:hypothetical protein
MIERYESDFTVENILVSKPPRYNNTKGKTNNTKNDTSSIEAKEGTS